MAACEMKVALIRHTPSPEEVVALGAKLCYARADVATLTERLEGADSAAFVEKLLQMGHESVLEHASFTFAVEGVSRVLLAQITRHRIASFSVQSQRYVSYGRGFSYVIPEGVRALGADAIAEFERQMGVIQSFYDGWQKLLPEGARGNEDARFVLPGACETRLLVTMNARELRHFFALRMCRRAQWEIRALAGAMFELCMGVAPALFRDAGPACLRGACGEGDKTCGQGAAVRAEREAFLAARPS